MNHLDLDIRSEFYVRTNLHRAVTRERTISLKWESKELQVIKMWTSEEKERNRCTPHNIFNFSCAIPPVWTSARSLKSCNTDSKETRGTLCSVQLWSWERGRETEEMKSISYNPKNAAKFKDSIDNIVKAISFFFLYWLNPKTGWERCIHG